MYVNSTAMLNATCNFRSVATVKVFAARTAELRLSRERVSSSTFNGGQVLNGLQVVQRVLMPTEAGHHHRLVVIQAYLHARQSVPPMCCTIVCTTLRTLSAACGAAVLFFPVFAAGIAEPMRSRTDKA